MNEKTTGDAFDPFTGGRARDADERGFGAS